MTKPNERMQWNQPHLQNPFGSRSLNMTIIHQDKDNDQLTTIMSELI